PGVPTLPRDEEPADDPSAATDDDERGGVGGPKAGRQGPEAPAAAKPDPDPDPLSPELPALPLLRSAVRSLGPPGQDAEAMTGERALLYLFVLHDHDRSGRLDVELLQLLGAVLEQRDGARPDPDAVAALVDRALERRDLSGDGMLDPSELLLPPGRDRGPPRRPLLQPPGEDAGVGGPAEGPGRPGGDAHPEGRAAPQDGAAEAPEAEAPPDGAAEAEEAPEAETPRDGVAEAAPEAEGPDTEAVEAGEAPGRARLPSGGTSGEGRRWGPWAGPCQPPPP
ncbi:LOW QUALITY PROTEIN: cell growth regulator with EF hand domain protein 1, partial [Porphyrio hochstetteri]